MLAVLWSCWSYLVSPAVPAVLVLRLHVEDVLHVQLEGLRAAGPHHAGPLVNLEPPTGCNEREGVNGSQNYNIIISLYYYSIIIII